MTAPGKIPRKILESELQGALESQERLMWELSTLKTALEELARGWGCVSKKKILCAVREARE